MKSSNKTKITEKLRYLPIIAYIIFIILFLLYGETIMIDIIKNYRPESLILAMIFFAIMYIFKSFSIVFPIMMLNMTCGFVFSPLIALLVASLGNILSLTTSYLMGKISGAKKLERLKEKYPKIEELSKFDESNSFFISFFLRTMTFLPLDVVSLYLGSKKLPYDKYLLGSFLALLPRMIAITLLGASITKSNSPMFWIMGLITILMQVLSYYLYKKWKKSREEH